MITSAEILNERGHRESLRISSM